MAQAEAMAVATAAPEDGPAVRMVLLKEHGPEGFVFYTDQESRKGRHLRANPRAALLFFWQPLGRQVRVEGRVETVSRDTAERYFKSRPPGSQVAAAVSHQSAPMTTRDELEARFAEVRAAAGEAGPALPDRWGGYRVIPDYFEFWEHQEDRLHDRLTYEREASGWRRGRLQP